MFLKQTVFVVFICMRGVPSEQLVPGKGLKESNDALDNDGNVYMKRPSGHSFVRFGKRDIKDVDMNNELHDVRGNQDPTWKREHKIIRFGKRAQAKHNFIRFGKRNGVPDETVKNSDQPMVYFEKKDKQNKIGGEYPGSYSGKVSPSQRSHSMMYFGKRRYQDSYDPSWSYSDAATNALSDDYSPNDIIFS